MSTQSNNRRDLLRQKETYNLLATHAAGLLNAKAPLIISAAGYCIQVPESDPYYNQLKDTINHIANTHVAKKLLLCEDLAMSADQ